MLKRERNLRGMRCIVLSLAFCAVVQADPRCPDFIQNGRRSFNRFCRAHENVDLAQCGRHFCDNLCFDDRWAQIGSHIVRNGIFMILGSVFLEGHLFSLKKGCRRLCFATRTKTMIVLSRLACAQRHHSSTVRHFLEQEKHVV